MWLVEERADREGLSAPRSYPLLLLCTPVHFHGRTPLAGTTGAKTEKPEDRGWEHGRQKTKHPWLRFEVSSQFPFSWMESPDLFLPQEKPAPSIRLGPVGIKVTMMGC